MDFGSESFSLARASIYAKHLTVYWEISLYLIENTAAVNSFTIFVMYYMNKIKKILVLTPRFSYSRVSIWYEFYTLA